MQVGAGVAAVVAGAMLAAASARADGIEQTRVLDKDVVVTATDVSAPHQPKAVLALTFRAHAGEVLRVTTQLDVRYHATKKNRDDLLFAAASVACGSTSAGWGENVLRDRPLVLAPRLLYKAPTTGDQTCTVTVFATRPRPAADGAPSWTLVTGSRLAVETVGADSISTTGAGQASPLVSTQPPPVRKLSAKWQQIVAAHPEAFPTPVASARLPVIDHWRAPGGAFELDGDIELTACTAVGGSADKTRGTVVIDGKPEVPELCRGYEVAGGTAEVRVRLVAEHSARSREGSPGDGKDTVATMTVTIDADTHHRMVALTANVAGGSPERCRNDYRFAIEVEPIGGVPVMVSAASANLTAIAKPSSAQ